MEYAGGQKEIGGSFPSIKSSNALRRDGLSSNGSNGLLWFRLVMFMPNLARQQQYLSNIESR